MDPNMISAQDALERLREGNRRFASNVRSLDALTSHARRNALAAGQAPFVPRLTITFAALAKARFVIIFCTGASKANEVGAGFALSTT